MSANAKSLEGQVAVITGASSGIGFGVAKGLSSEGAAVVINYRKHSEEAHELADEINGNGGKALAVHADVSLEKDVTKLFLTAVSKFGGVDILVQR
jgi:NAD(P)-dependent dehydrogenase (short-subunit alcohol dehydrogenase family)